MRIDGRSSLLCFSLLTSFAFLGCRSTEVEVSQSETTNDGAPVAAVRAKKLETHGHVRTDDYYWLRERESEEVRAYLEAENAYVEKKLGSTKELQKELYEEMVARVPQDDETVPYRLGSFEYYTRFEDGKQYPIHCRRNGATKQAGNEEVLLDLNQMAGEKGGFLSVGSRAVSPDENHIAYGVDRVGRRIYTIEVKDLKAGKVIDRIPDVTSNVVWAEDGETLFYSRQDPETLRTYQVWRHKVGQEGSELVFEEKDTEFSCFVGKTRSRRFLVIGSSHTLSTEYRILDAEDPNGNFQVVIPRQRDHEYSIDHHGHSLYLVSNHKAKNFRLFEVPLDRLPLDLDGASTWKERLPHRSNVLLEDVELQFLVLGCQTFHTVLNHS